MRYFTTTEAAAVLNVDPSRIRLLCKLGRIETIKIGNTYGIAEDVLQRFASIPRRAGRPRRGAAGSRQNSATMPFENRILSNRPTVAIQPLGASDATPSIAATLADSATTA